MDFINLFNLMKQAPEFSIIVGAIFIYLLIFFIKAKGRDEVLKIIKPMDLRLQRIEKKLNITDNGL
jgi:hypothetical protein